MDGKYRFRIDSSYTPATFPMERLAEYMAQFSRLLGEEDNVHFGAFEAGSAVLVVKVDDPARVKVSSRIRHIRDRTAAQEILKTYAELDDMLRNDNARAELIADNGIIIPFPGRDRPEPTEFGPFKQDGTLDGQVIRVGGKGENMPVHLRDGSIIYSSLYATPELARQIAKHLLGPSIRVHGIGTWFRSDSSWELKNFKITDFEVLEDAPLAEVVANLRRVKGSQWEDVLDPVRALLEERHGEGDAH